MRTVFFVFGVLLGGHMAVTLVSDGGEMHVAFRLIFVGYLAVCSGVAWDLSFILNLIARDRQGEGE